MRITTSLMLSSSALGLCLLAAPASAQTSEAPTGPQAGASAGVAEVVVTAQKREQRLQDVPVAVSVVGGGQLVTQGIVDATQLAQAVPELTFGEQYNIRGVGTTTFTRSSENDVSVVVDGVIQGQLQPPVNGLFDVARVEVLSGPQGMLFGKNASAGVINIVTNAPKLNRYEFIGHADIGEDGYQVYQAVANLPVGDKAALRISAFSNAQDNILKNNFNGTGLGGYTDAGVRARLLWAPTAALTFNLIGDYEKDHGGGALWTSRVASPAMAFLLGRCGVTPGKENTHVCLDGPNGEGRESYGLSGQIDWRFGDYSLTSITAVRQYSNVGLGDADTLPINLLNLNLSKDYDSQFSQEIRLASPTGQRLEYVLGLFYYNYHYKPFTDQAGELGFLPVPADRASVGGINQFSYAIFGQATYHVWGGLSLIVGGRETRDILSSTTTNFVNTANGIALPGFSTVGTYSGKVDTNNFSYRLGSQYKLSPSDMLYLTYSRGYKGAAVNNLAPGTAGPAIVNPEIPIDLEAGYKTSLFERRLVLDVSLFDETIKNFQAQVFETVGGLGTFVFANASKLRVRGVQGSFYSKPLPGLTVNGGLIYNDATYGDFIVPCNAAYTAGCTTSGGNLVTNARGEQLAQAPKWKLTAMGEYDHRLTNRFDGFVEADASYQTAIHSSPTPDPNTTIPAYAIVNGRFGVRSADGRYTVAVFAKNLFDQRAPATIFTDPLQPAGNYDQIFLPNAFRVIGVSLDVRY